MGKARIIYIDVLLVVFVSCTASFINPLHDSAEIDVEMPAIPEAWYTLLGSPAWRVEWMTENGSLATLQAPAGTRQVKVPLSVHQAGPLWAWPCWPQLGIEPHRTRPAGALLPLDVIENRCRLTWMGGVEASFFRYLQTSPGDSRYGPEYFNWPRFRSLFSDKRLAQEVLSDPWRVDWSLVAIKTKLSGFDSRRLTPRPVQVIPITLPVLGPWVSDSPFVPAIAESPDAGGLQITLHASAAVDTILSTHGIISYSWDGIAYIPGLPDP
jgi:hypothetical protein